jgi:hypothetical protein
VGYDISPIKRVKFKIQNGGENYFSHYCGVLTPAEPVMEKSVIL